MADISNKLHALVDEFVSNLSSECVSLANNVVAEVHVHVAHDSAIAEAPTQRPSNRTTTEVLNGLRRPSPSPLSSSYHREGKSQVQHVKSSLLTGNNKNREEGRNMRFIEETKASIVALQELGDPNCVNSVEHDIEDILSREVENNGDEQNHIKPKRRHTEDVEVLSPDSASSESLRPRAKQAARRRGGKPATKGRETTSQGRSRRMETRSPSRSPESSHVMTYSYEENTPSIGGTSPHGESTFLKLRWPVDSGASHEDGETVKKSDINEAHCNTEYRPKTGRKKTCVDTSVEEGDESNGEDTGRNPNATYSDTEEMHVLPKIPVKQKGMNQPRVTEIRSQRGRTKSTSPQNKK